MKKLIVCFLLMMVIICFTSCEKVIELFGKSPDSNDLTTEPGNEVEENTEIEHKHTFGEWQYDETAHWCSWDCSLDACDIDTYAEHYDKDNDFICDVCGYFDVVPPHTEHTGEWKWNEESHSYQYTCGCVTEEIAELHYDHDSDFLCDACGYNMKTLEPDTGAEIIPLTEYQPWLNEITEADVKEIKTISCDGWSYEEFNSIISTTNKGIISVMISDLKQVTIEYNPLIDYDILPGSFEVEFYLTGGSVKRISFNGGGYMYNGNPVNMTPTLDRESFTDVSRRYSFASYGRFTDVYYHDMLSSLSYGYKKGRINPEMIEFVECDVLHVEDCDRFYYYFDTALGRVSILGKRHFVLGEVTYEIINYNQVDLSAIQTVITAREDEYNDGRVAFVKSYYGIFESGAVVAMVTDDKTGYTEALWSEKIAEYTFQYYNGNRIVVLYDGEFYTLPEAYENGYLTLTDIYTIWNLHS